MKLYSNISTHDTIVEFWGASTKHPDAVHSMKNDIDAGRFTPSLFGPDVDTFQWLLLIASEKTFPFHAASVARTALAIYETLWG